MSNAADGYLGDWLPHKAKCSCTDCQLDRAIAALKNANAENERLRGLLREFMDSDLRQGTAEDQQAYADLCKRTDQEGSRTDWGRIFAEKKKRQLNDGPCAAMVTDYCDCDWCLRQETDWEISAASRLESTGGKDGK